MVKCVVKFKNCRIGRKIGVVVDMDPSDKKAKRQKAKKKKVKKKKKKMLHSKRPMPPTAFSVPKRNKKLEVVRRRKWEKKEEKQEKSQSEDPHYHKGHV